MKICHFLLLVLSTLIGSRYSFSNDLAKAPIHSDLDIEPLADQRTLEAIDQAFSDLRNMESFVTKDTAEVKIPDYKPAAQELAKQINASLEYYLRNLIAIRTEIVTFIKQVNAIDTIRVKAGRTDLIEKARKDMIVKNVGPLQKRINDLYSLGLRSLYLLEGPRTPPQIQLNALIEAPVLSGLGLSPVFGKVNHIFFERPMTSGSYISAISKCNRTWMCAMNISYDLKEYFAFIQNLNVTFDFAHPEKRKFLSRSLEVKPPLLVSGAMADLAKKLVDIKLEPNRQWSETQILKHYVGKIVLDAPAGAAVGLAAVPTRFLETIFADDSLDLYKNFLPDLKIKMIKTQTLEWISSSIDLYAEEHAKSLNLQPVVFQDE